MYVRIYMFAAYLCLFLLLKISRFVFQYKLYALEFCELKIRMYVRNYVLIEGRNNVVEAHVTTAKLVWELD